MKMPRVMAGLLLIGCSDFALEPDAGLPTRLEVGPDNQTILTGESLQLEARAYDAAGKEVEVPGWVTTHWTVDDPRITVYDGEVTGQRGAVARVTASVAGLSGGTVIRINPAVLDVEITIALSQAIQDPYANIPLIANRDLIFRAFVTSSETNFYEPVGLRATFRLGDSSVSTPVLELSSADEFPSELIDDLKNSYFHNVAIAGSWIQPNTVLEIDLDPEGKLDPRLGLNPSTMTFELPVVTSPTHRQIVVPSLLAVGTTDEILSVVNSLAQDTLAILESIFPIYDMEVEIHEPLRLSTDLCRIERDRNGDWFPAGWNDYLSEIDLVRVAEGRTGWYYAGVVTRGRCPQNTLPVGGIAEISGYSAAAIANPGWALIHEIGHNFSLMHAPCTYDIIGGVDSNFPHSNGGIGYWGFDIMNERIYDPRWATDIMGYCWRGPQWISAYHFDKVRRWRHRPDEDAVSGDAVLVWGTVTDAGVDLEPSFRVATALELPDGEGDYTLAVIGPDGEPGYQSRFTPKGLSEGDVSHFTFAIPYDGDISRIEVWGPAGADAIGRGTEQPVAMWWRDNAVVGILRDWQPVAYSGRAGMRVMISEGVPR